MVKQIQLGLAGLQLLGMVGSTGNANTGEHGVLFCEGLGGCGACVVGDLRQQRFF
jgi:hypothetical protein